MNLSATLGRVPDGILWGSRWVFPAFSAIQNVLGKTNTPDKKTVCQGCVFIAGEHTPHLLLCSKPRKEEAGLLHFLPLGLRMSSESSFQTQVLGLGWVWISLRIGHVPDAGARMYIYICRCLQSLVGIDAGCHVLLGRREKARFTPSLQAVCLPFVVSTQKGCDFFF